MSIPEKDLRIVISRWCHGICKRGPEAPSQILFPPGLVIQEHRVQRQQAISPSPERARGSLCHALLPLGALWLGCFCVHLRESSPGLTQARKASISPHCLACSVWVSLAELSSNFTFLTGLFLAYPHENTSRHRV